MLVLGVVMNFLLIPILGIAALAFTTAASAWLNALALYVILHARGHFRIEGWLWGRILKQLFAAAVMAAVLYFMQGLFEGFFAGSTGRRIVAVGTLVAVGSVVYFGIVWIIGGMDKEDVLALVRRKKVES
jgi:putative peptidoglycan lipid II flippase